MNDTFLFRRDIPAKGGPSCATGLSMQHPGFQRHVSSSASDNIGKANFSMITAFLELYNVDTFKNFKVHKLFNIKKTCGLTCRRIKSSGRGKTTQKCRGP